MVSPGTLINEGHNKGDRRNYKAGSFEKPALFGCAQLSDIRCMKNDTVSVSKEDEG